VITDADIRDYYQKHKSRYTGEGRVHLRHIVMTVPSPAGEAEKQQVREKLNQIRRQVEEGASFAALAREYSQSPLADEGGDLGSLAIKDLASDIINALEGVKAGEVTPIVENDRGMQLFYVEALEQVEGKPLEEVSAEIEDILYDEIVNQKFMAWLQDLRERSHIKIIR
jgi:parvulin-like peptidyl-prolyl isomerase